MTDKDLSPTPLPIPGEGSTTYFVLAAACSLLPARLDKIEIKSVCVLDTATGQHEHMEDSPRCVIALNNYSGEGVRGRRFGKAAQRPELSCEVADIVRHLAGRKIAPLGTKELSGRCIDRKRERQ